MVPLDRPPEVFVRVSPDLYRCRYNPSSVPWLMRKNIFCRGRHWISPFGRQWLAEPERDTFVPTEPEKFAQMLE